MHFVEFAAKMLGRSKGLSVGTFLQILFENNLLNFNCSSTNWSSCYK